MPAGNLPAGTSAPGTVVCIIDSAMLSTAYERRRPAPRCPCGPNLRDRGESLVEIVITVVIIGITVTALVSGLGSVAAAGNAHRVGVQADTVMRNYAEATKSAVRDCVEGAEWKPDFSPPDGFRVSMSPEDTSCPGVKEARRLELTVDSPIGTRQVLTIVVRTP